VNCKTLLALCGVVWLALAAPASAQTAAPKGKPPTAEEREVANRYQQRFGSAPDAVSRTPWGWWEIVQGNEVLYVDREVNYVLAGQVFDAKTRENLTQKKIDELQRIDWKSLPLNDAIKLVRGNGSRVFATFEDPNCPYCKRLHADLRNIKDATIYVFLYPILSQDSFDKAKAIWCAKDRAAAWDDCMVENNAPPPAPADCKNPLQKVLEIGQKAGVTGTPTIFFTDGNRLPGAVPVAQIDARLTALAGKK
jgi:thiol:disulfide interchange protein DsbC